MKDYLFCEDFLKREYKELLGSCNLVVTSPPYNVNLKYNTYEDNKEYSDYLNWMRKIFEKCYKYLKEDGRICINIGDAKNGKIPTHSDFIQILKELNFLPITTIIWKKNNIKSLTAWGSYMSPSCPSFPRDYEYLIVMGKTQKLIHKGKTSLTKEKFIECANGTWLIAPEHVSKLGHPAAFPVELPKRCIEMFTYEEDLILDPFMGSGTTAIAAMRTNRHFIGFEIDEKYFNLSQERIKKEILK